MTRDQYIQKLKDPRWQKRRLEILERDNWTCQLCEDKDSTLTVHHRYYEKGKDPWDYPDKCLTTLCETCHEDETRILAQAPELLNIIRRSLWGVDLESLAVAMAHHGDFDYEDLSLSLACWVIENPDSFRPIFEFIREQGLLRGHCLPVNETGRRQI